jgi:hypothetical protein
VKIKTECEWFFWWKNTDGIGLLQPLGVIQGVGWHQVSAS